MRIYASQAFGEHQTGVHPERPERTMVVNQRLAEAGRIAEAAVASWSPATRETLLLVHDPGYLEKLTLFASPDPTWIDRETNLSPRSFEVACLASGAVVDAVDRMALGEEPRAFIASRPPGHHALADRAMGFCLLNHIAVGARYAIEQHRFHRVLIVDWDVHHGNGTQAIFWEDPSVGFFSMHRWPFYPGTGGRDETGSGRGLGLTWNLPLAYGTPAHEVVERFCEEVSQFADRIEPDLLLVSAGFDAHWEDPLGGLSLEIEHFQQMSKHLHRLAQRHTQGRLLSLLEGGYHLKNLPELVLAHLDALDWADSGELPSSVPRT
ncbi:MAG: histone deacetylase [Pirellulaceae bacterium]|jgi:acetoin utilization deacetylase AcuC-like enzyme